MIKNTEEFALRKIPVTQKFQDDLENSENEFFLDKTKIIEFANSIDEWERSILFAENGFYSLKGKDAKEKLKEYVSELENFANLKYSELHLSDLKSSKIFLKVKKEKINLIIEQMKKHESKELKSWQLDVFEKAIEASKQRAVLYKNDDNIVNECLNNGLAVVNLIAKEEQWGKNLLQKTCNKYKAEFYSALIDDFIAEKNIKAEAVFSLHKNLFDDEKCEKLEKSVTELKTEIIAYNWAKELTNYDLSKEDEEKEFKEIKDEDVKKSAKEYLKIFKQRKKLQEEDDNKTKNLKNWEEIKKNLKENSGYVFLDVDRSLNEKSSVKKKDYIKKIANEGYVETTADDYLKLLQDFLNDYKKYKKQDISDYNTSIAEEDLNFFYELQNVDENEILLILSDLECIQKEFKEKRINSAEKKYKFYKMFFVLLKMYKSENKKTADLSVRNKILEELKKRFN